MQSIQQFCRKLGVFWIAAICASCTTVPSDYQNPLEKNIDEFNEGFFTPQQLPKAAFGESEPSPEMLQRFQTNVGVYVAKVSLTISPESYQQEHEIACGSELSQKLNSELCSFLRDFGDRCAASGCMYDGPLATCSGFRFRNFFITARHCMPEDSFPAEPFAVFQREDGSLKRVKLRKTILVKHLAPYDVAIFRMFGSRFEDIELDFRDSDLAYREPVIGMGHPWLPLRKGQQQRTDYSLEADFLRLTYGRVMQPNEAGRSFCEFTNESGVTNVEDWELENGCKQHSQLRIDKGFGQRYLAREERDPLLTNSDFIRGMDGSPLFDASGLIVGMATTVLSNNPARYDRDKYAVYVKAKNIYALLRSIEPRLKSPEEAN